MEQQASLNFRFVRTYYVRGKAPSFWRHTNDIDNPPTSGYSHAIVIPGPKRSTILCPFTLLSYQVRNTCGEMAWAEDRVIGSERLAGIIEKSWEDCVNFGWQREYGLAAAILTELGHAVPKFLPPPVERHSDEPSSRGGKPLEAKRFKPVDPQSKRGLVAAFFKHEEPQSLHEAMARLEMSRSGVLSHLYTLHQVHGIGYELMADCARLLVPAEFDLFAWTAPEKKEKPQPIDTDGQPREVKKRSAGKPIEADKLAPIFEPSKRAIVAKTFLTWKNIEEAMSELGLNRSAVLSHLFTINAENGLGYEMSEDRTQARLLIPEGRVLFAPKPPRVPKVKE